MEKFKGIFPALLTPFDSRGRINETALAQLVEMNIQKGVRGFYVCGSTAEVFLLHEEERKALYRLVKDVAGDRVTLIAHVGDVSTEKAQGYAHLAEKLGYDAISAVAPFYYKFSFDEVKRYYFDIAGAVDLPMIVYNFPNFSGVNLSVDQIGQFLSDDRFLGVKHTSNDYFALSQFKTAFPHKVIYNGFDEMMLAGLSMGADGGIGSTYNFMADKFIRLMSLFAENRMDEAQALQKEINIIIAALCRVGVMQGEKAILCALGLDFGIARAPFAPLTAEQEKGLLDTVMPRL